MKRTSWIKILLPVLLLSLAACSSGDSSESTIIEASGFIEAQTYPVISLTTSVVQEVLVAPGESVSEGQVVVTLDLDQLEAHRLAALADYEEALAELERLEAAPTAAEEAALEAAVARAEVDLQAAETAREQLEEAYGDDPPEMLADPAEATLELAQAAVDLAEAQLAQAKAGTRAEELQMVQAAVNAAQAQLRLTELEIELAGGKTPRDGLVQQILVEVGEAVAPGMRLATVAATDQLFLTVYVDQEQVALIEIGALVEVRVDAYPDRTFEGTVRWVADEAQFTPTTVQTEAERVALVFAVRIEIDNADGLLLAGMPADIIIQPGDS